jgi:malate dehydrogenase (oxaloacetate-decarboxylating)(NADP+)
LKHNTASVALAGLIASVPLAGKRLSDMVILFAGAGEAGTGIAELIAYAVSIESGISLQEARKKIFLVDSHGLVTKSRLSGLRPHKVHFAHAVEEDCLDLLTAVNVLKPTALIGVSAVPSSFTQEICQQMAAMNERPIICALSNPTSKAECTAQQAYEWTNGQAIFASGSPSAPVTLPDGRHFVPGQGTCLLMGLWYAYVYTYASLHMPDSLTHSLMFSMLLVAQETMPTYSQALDWVSWPPGQRVSRTTTCSLRRRLWQP